MTAWPVERWHDCVGQEARHVQADAVVAEPRGALLIPKALARDGPCRVRRQNQNVNQAITVVSLG
jgi:hypothetical protein